jgi:hypothetical protein
MVVKAPASIVCFTIKPVGPSRTEDQIRRDVQAALEEALENYKAREMRPIAQHYNSVESQARFRTIPVNEFIDGVTITSLGV